MRRYRVLLVFFLALPLLSLIKIPTNAQESAEQAQIERETIEFYQQRELTASPEIKSRLQALRGEISAKKYTFRVGYSKAMDYQIEQIAGLREPPDLEQQITKQNAAAQNLVDRKIQAAIQATCSSNAGSFDWRSANGSTLVRDQGNCGSCWAFSTAGAFEGAFKIKNSIGPDSSEQDILDCNPWGYDCSGGWWAFQHLIDTGIAREIVYPYTAAKGACKTNITRPCKATAWGYVGNTAIPSVSSIKQALCQYGPLSVAVLVTPFFHAYTGGVLNEQADTWHASTLYNLYALVKSPAGNIYAAYTAGTSGSTQPPAVSGNLF